MNLSAAILLLRTNLWRRRSHNRLVFRLLFAVALFFLRRQMNSESAGCSSIETGRSSCELRPVLAVCKKLGVRDKQAPRSGIVLDPFRIVDG